jgi:hypothetical protein
LKLKATGTSPKASENKNGRPLTDDDLRYIEGKQEELLGRIQKRTGETREAVETAVKEATSSCCSN